MMRVAIKKIDPAIYFPFRDKGSENKKPNSIIITQAMIATGMENTFTALDISSK